MNTKLAKNSLLDYLEIVAIKQENLKTPITDIN